MATFVSPSSAVTGEADTRMRVLRLLLEQTSCTAGDVAESLSLTGTAVRRHLHQLAADGYAEPAPTPKSSGGRGRPAAAWRITASGRTQFGHSYDELARQALEALRASGGEEAVVAFARHRARTLLADVVCSSPSRRDNDPEQTGHHTCSPQADATVDQLAQAFRRHGYAATVEHAGGGVQLCQHHCPVSQVARDFPQLCEAEAEIIAEVMGRPVQSLATIPAGNGVCTTNIPPPKHTASAG